MRLYPLRAHSSFRVPDTSACFPEGAHTAKPKIHNRLRATEGSRLGYRGASLAALIQPLGAASEILRSAPKYLRSSRFGAAPPFYEPRCQASPGVGTMSPLGRFLRNSPASRRFAA